MPFEIITVEEAAAELEIASNARLARIVAAVHSDLAKGCGRTFERVERTVYPQGWGRNVNFVFLPEAPIVEVLEVRIDAAGEFGTGSIVADTPETIAANFRWTSSDTDFQLYYLNGCFPEGHHTVMVRYVGGWWSQSDEDAGHATGKPPADLGENLLRKVAERYNQRGEVFQAQSTSGVESFSRFADNAKCPLAAAIRRYKRPA